MFEKFNKVFYDSIFTIAIRETTEDDISLNSNAACNIRQFHWYAKASLKEWYADPIMVKESEKTFIFFECV